MAVISCANCATAVNAAASGCPQCGADPRSGEGASLVDELGVVPYVPIPAHKLILAGFGCAMAAWFFWLLAWLVFWYSPFTELSAAAGVLVPIFLSPTALVCAGGGLRNARRQHTSLWLYLVAVVSILLAAFNVSVFIWLCVLWSGGSVLD